MRAIKGRILDSDYLGYVSSGEGTLRYGGGEAMRIGSGACFFLPAGVHHDFDPVENTTWDEYWVLFDANAARAAFGDILPRPGEVVYPGIDLFLQTRWTELRDLLYMDRELHRHRLNFLLHHLLFAIHAAAPQVERPPQDPLMLRAQRLILQAIDLQRPVVAEDVATACGLGYEAFRRRFRRVTGSSPKRFELDMKFRLACDLLVRSPLRVKEIAARLGYDDPYFFSRFFTERAGCSPQDYRRRNMTFF